MAYDATRREVVLFGGHALDLAATNLTDTWTLQRRTWVGHQPLTHPGPMANDLMVYDERRLAAVLVGSPEAGRGYGPAQTWSWDGTTWTRLDDVPLTDTEVLGSLASDRSHGQTVLLTGVAPKPGSGAASHTWTFDGRSWSLRHPPQALPGAAPRLATIGPDAPARWGRGVLAVMGDADGGASTWLWDGATWSKLDSGSTPAYDPLGSAMALDAQTGLVVLIAEGGGATWLWNGTAWRRGGPAPDVDSLYGGTSLLSDGFAGHVIVIGDRGRPNRFDVLWMFTAAGWVSDRSA